MRRSLTAGRSLPLDRIHHDAIIRSFGAELSFYAQVFGFEPADDIEPLEIQFLAESRARA